MGTENIFKTTLSGLSSNFWLFFGSYHCGIISPCSQSHTQVVYKVRLGGMLYKHTNVCFHGFCYPLISCGLSVFVFELPQEIQQPSDLDQRWVWEIAVSKHIGLINSSWLDYQVLDCSAAPAILASFLFLCCPFQSSQRANFFGQALRNSKYRLWNALVDVSVLIHDFQAFAFFYFFYQWWVRVVLWEWTWTVLDVRWKWCWILTECRLQPIFLSHLPPNSLISELSVKYWWKILSLLFTMKEPIKSTSQH